MKKIHTKIKRRLGLSTHKNWYYPYFHPNLVKRRRAKTFNTEEAANAWALKNGLKPEQYSLKNVKKNKKFEIVREDGKNKNNFNKKNSA